MGNSSIRLVSIILALSVVVGAWLLFEYGQGSSEPPVSVMPPPETTTPNVVHRPLPGAATSPSPSPSSTADTRTAYKCRGPVGVSYRTEPCHGNEKEVNVVTSTVVQPDPNELAALKAKANQMEAHRLAAENSRVASVQPARSVPDRRFECDSIDRDVALLDAQLRQPHSPSWGDYLTGKRKGLMDRRFSIGC